MSHAFDTFFSGKLHFKKCLCTKHQNFALKLKALISVGGKLNTNPDTVAKLSIAATSSFVNDLAVNKVVFPAWKKVDIAFKKGTEEVVKKGLVN